jgi:hypothetical protein
MTAANEPIPFTKDTFKVLIGLDSDDRDIRMRAEVIDAKAMKDGSPDLSDPAVFFARWLVANWDGIRNMAAGEYNVRQNLAMVTAKPALQLVDPNGGRLQ